MATVTISKVKTSKVVAKSNPFARKTKGTNRPLGTKATRKPTLLGFTKVKIARSLTNSRKYDVYVSPISWKGKFKKLGTAGSYAKAEALVTQYARTA